MPTNPSDEINWGISLLAMVPASIAAWCSYGAAKAARDQSKASWKQVDLMRPKPVIVLEKIWSFNDTATTQQSSGIMVRNIGTGPAFNIRISDISGPQRNADGQYVGCLATDPIHALAEKEQVEARHNRKLSETVIDRDSALRFVEAVSMPLHAQNQTEGAAGVLGFVLSYSSLDNRYFRTQCRMIFDFSTNSMTARIEPASTWFGEEIQGREVKPA